MIEAIVEKIWTKLFRPTKCFGVVRLCYDQCQPAKKGIISLSALQKKLRANFATFKLKDKKKVETKQPLFFKTTLNKQF